MRILRFDGTGGASGDMILAALEAVGAPLDAARAAVAALGLDGVRFEIEDARDRGLSGRRVRVVLTDAPASAHDHAHDHAHEHGSAHDHAHDHVHAHAEDHGHPHAHGTGAHGHGAAGHEHRAYAAIRAMIAASTLPDAVKSGALSVFRRLAEAEGRMHGIEPDRVQFHEVGALDSIADMVGACAMLSALAPDRVECGPLPLASGEIVCAHGVYPLPAPATMDLLKDFPVRWVEEEGELVTPTGAALLTDWCARHAAAAPAGGGRVLRSGYGVGHRSFARRANVLRATLIAADSAAAGEDAADVASVLECEMDDCTGEWAGELCAHLLAEGALDAHLTAVQMKKQRPGWRLTVLARPSDRARLVGAIFRRATTFGLRVRDTERLVLARRWQTVETPYGPVRVKLGAWQGETVTAAPEMDDCIARAAAAGVPPREVHAAAMAAWRPGAKP